jgi:hypothetical protein
MVGYYYRLAVVVAASMSGRMMNRQDVYHNLHLVDYSAVCCLMVHKEERFHLDMLEDSCHFYLE